MKTKLFTLGVILWLSTCLAAQTSGTCGTNLTWTLQNGVLTISGTGAMNDYSIWDRAPWYSLREQVTSLIIGNNVTSIGNYAFWRCSGLTTVTVPNNILRIGESAFSECSGMTSITLSNSITSLEYGVFSMCIGLTSITLPYGVTTIGEFAFYVDSALTSITIPNSVTNIKQSAFVKCKGLTSITIPNSVTRIEWQVFQECSNLTSVTIGNGVSSIGHHSFSDCEALTSVIWNAVNCTDFSSASQSPFFYRRNITSFVFGDSVQHIPAFLCSHLHKLDTVTIPQDVTSIGQNAFDSCCLTHLTCEPMIPPTIGSDVFKNCNFSSIYVPCGTKEDYQSAFGYDSIIQYKPIPIEYSIEVKVDDAHKNNAVVEILLPNIDICDTLVSIVAKPNPGYHLLQWSDGNTDNPRRIELTQDTSFTAIIAQTFAGQCGDSLYWNYANDTLHFTGEGNMYDYTATTIPWAILKDSIRAIIFADGMTSVGDYAFMGHWNMDGINFSSNIESIGESAFNGCSGLQHVTIPNSIVTVRDYAFANCTSLDTLIVGAGITSISKQFYWCSNIQHLQLGQNVQLIDRGAFFDARRLNSIVCLAPEPPTAFPDENDQHRSFYNSNALVLILCDNFSAYQQDGLWGNFNLQCLSANDDLATEGIVMITSGDADATFTWPIFSDADTYTLEITKDDEAYCTLTFNASGQLLGFAFAPSRDERISQAPQATLTTNGMTFQVTALDYASHYHLTFEAKNPQQETIFAYATWFATKGATGTEQISSEPTAQPVKIYDGGRLYILLPDGTRYDATGKKVE